ncbi:ParB/RepB/Spo0J family partition protein [Gulosibacter faecalis]|jgi:ParB family chromosome partitioning protein|uniref:ParB/RepB/Spo0J family partition protein n=1 Tax=Gulosibacter faecalis TaxID=272240 RepID=A0ABW5UWE0_9MICO|nr:ParB/RepB/Spo0J family partition protein [Gulosibacter faecalis]
MAQKKRSGLGRGLSALIPSGTTTEDRDIDVFFNGSAPSGRQAAGVATAEAPAEVEAVEVETIETQTPETQADEPAAPAKKQTKPTAAKSTRTTSKSRSTSKSNDVEPAASTADDAVSDASTNIDVATEEATEDTAEPELLPVPGATLRTLDPSRIVPNARQPRHEFDQDALDELIISVREFGVLQPIVVRPLPAGDPRAVDGDFELIMGERRLRATKAARRDEIPAIVRETEDEDMLRDALLENLHRAELNPLEEASAYRQLLDDFGCTQDELAERIGRSRPRISNTLRLLNLPVDVQRRVAAGVLSAGHARAVLSVGEPAAMTQLADKIVNEGLSVRESETAAATLATRAGRAERPTRKDAPAGSDSLAAHLEEVGERLGDRLNTRVKVVLRKTKGTITIDFASMADLTRILEDLGEDEAE